MAVAVAEEERLFYTPKQPLLIKEINELILHNNS
jgi:hypothetical protein